ncbi:MAG: hypothetical protein IPM16_23045 [Chloroflexi bacterium]|nr:hypothetical protein [Chloroflexota bacterium]
MDMDTFFTTLYVLVDDWYKAEIAESMQRHRGGRMRMSDSEVLTVALAGQWQAGMPWRSEREVVAYVQRHLRGLFPTMLGRSAFNRRVRCLWGGFVRLQQLVAEQLRGADELYESVDSVPVPSLSNGQAQRQSTHWTWQSRRGRGSYGRFVWGERVLMAVSPSGVIRGWIAAGANVNDRWLLEALLNRRAGGDALHEPKQRPRDGNKPRTTPPAATHLFGWAAVGETLSGDYLADRGFNGRRWRQQWQQAYGARVLAPPPPNEPGTWSAAQHRWLASHRQIVETVFARLDNVFGFKRLLAHSRWGQLTRLAAKTAAYNIGLYLNRMLNRPLGALATLFR